MIRKNIFWNLSGLVLPLLAAFFLYPLIISRYGLDRFGLLTLAWSIVGYFNLFDLGLSRALTQLVSERIDYQEKLSEVQSLVNTTFMVMWCLGALGGFFLWVISPYLVNHLLNIAYPFNLEAIRGFSTLSIAIPFLVSTAAIRGVLEAQQRFMAVSLIRTLLGIGTFAAPYIASFYGANLWNACYSLVVLRIFVWVLYALTLNNSGFVRVNWGLFDRKWLSPLFRFGSWMTVTNLVSPVMDYLDRFLIVSILGTLAVSYYVAPFEVVTKASVLASSIAGVLFPLFAKNFKVDLLGSAKLLGRGISYTLVLLYPIIFVVCIFAKEWLSVWLGDDFSKNSSEVVILIGVGVLVNSVAQVFFAKVQGAGRSDWTAKLHLIELPFYLLLVWWGLQTFGIVGAAFAWFARTFVDMFGLFYLSTKLNKHTKDFVVKPIIIMLLGLIFLGIISNMVDLHLRLLLGSAALSFYLFLVFKLINHDGLFSLIKERLK